MPDSCPYKSLPENAWWRHSVSGIATGEVNPAATAPFTITTDDRIVTAGSCFAQNVARWLPRLGLKYEVAEPGPDTLTSAERSRHQYGTFSARYGNIYTTRQLLQLLQRAFGTFAPVDNHWRNDEGNYIDPYRPTIEPDGFANLSELEWDRQHHLNAVKDLVLNADVFVFTLGLTESWYNATDGAVYPACPGCGSGGDFDETVHKFVNYRAREVADDLNAAIALMRQYNPGLRIILTVSPVPLIATMSGNHVLEATTYSKSVLRVAAQECAEDTDQCVYFPSYEIITGQHAGRDYYGNDLRSINHNGVAHVMGCFEQAFCGTSVINDERALEAKTKTIGTSSGTPDDDQYEIESHSARQPRPRSITQVVCDEDILAQRYR